MAQGTRRGQQRRRRVRPRSTGAGLGDPGHGSRGVGGTPRGTRGVAVSALRKKDILTPLETATVMVVAGFPRDFDVLSDGVSIVEGESDFKRAVTSYTGCCTGLFQINWRDAHNATKACALDNLCNTRAAHRLWSADKSWGDWVVRPNRAHGAELLLHSAGMPDGAGASDVLDFVTGAAGDVAGGIASGAGAVWDAATSMVDVVKQIVAFIARLFEPSFWLRVGKAILGAVAMGIGTVILARAILGVDLPATAEAFAGKARARYADRRTASMEPPSAAQRSKGRRAIEDTKGWQSPDEEVPF